MMYKYAINNSEHLTICDCETDWRKDFGWTEEMYTGDIYKCKIAVCPYKDAVLSDFDFVNDEVKFNEGRYLERTHEEKSDNLRIIRQSLLLAFDKYKTNVAVGIENDAILSEEILNWYQAVLDLNEEAINNPPERIKYYL